MAAIFQTSGRNAGCRPPPVRLRFWRPACTHPPERYQGSLSARTRQPEIPTASRDAQEVCVTNRRNGMRWVMTLVMGLTAGAMTVKPAAAQSTIFNIPSTDTVAKSKGYFEFDYVMQLPKPDA